MWQIFEKASNEMVIGFWVKCTEELLFKNTVVIMAQKQAVNCDRDFGLRFSLIHLVVEFPFWIPTPETVFYWWKYFSQLLTSSRLS